MKVSRPIRELAWKAYAVRERLERENGRDPTLAEIAGELDVTVEEIVEAMESGAEVESLQKTIYQGENHDISLMDRIPEKENGQEKLLNRIFLEELLGRLPAKERQLIYMRYFQDMTQAQIAGKLGISQVQVSRMEKKILRQMRMEKVWRIKEEKKGEAGKGGRKFENIHWNIGGRCATMSEIRRKAGGRTWII